MRRHSPLGSLSDPLTRARAYFGGEDGALHGTRRRGAS
jgi:hypothetical protein